MLFLLFHASPDPWAVLRGRSADLRFSLNLLYQCRWYENATAFFCFVCTIFSDTRSDSTSLSTDKHRVALAAAARATGALAAAPPPSDRRQRMGAPTPQQRTGAPKTLQPASNHNLHRNIDRLLCYLSFRHTSVQQRCQHRPTRFLIIRDERWRNAAQRPSLVPGPDRRSGGPATTGARLGARGRLLAASKCRGAPI